MGLTREQVEEARTRFHQGGEGYAALARIFHVARSTMKKAIDGDTWKHLPVATYRRPKTPAPKGSTKCRK